MSSWKLILSVLVVIVAYYYLEWQNDELNPKKYDLSEVIISWKSIIKNPERQFKDVTIGINACVDLIVSGVELLSALGVNPGSSRDHGVLATLEALQETFHHNFKDGKGSERYFMDGNVFNEVINVASKLGEAQWYIGGNAALMAQKMAINFPSLKLNFIGPVGPHLRVLFHENITIADISLIPADEVHLIMEFGVGERWGDTVAPVATRFITSHDIANSRAQYLEPFFAEIRNSRPDLVVLSGLHMLEGQTPEVRGQRLKVTQAELTEIDAAVPIHLELASMVHEDLVKQIVKQVLPGLTSLGLNEQELALLSDVMGGPHEGEILNSQGHPDIHKVTDILAWLLATYGHDKNKHSRLTRVHFHTLTFHILAVVPGHWENNIAAVAAGSRAASHQACDTQTLDQHLIELRIPREFSLYSGGSIHSFNATSPVIDFRFSGFEFAFSPVLVCKKPLKTVGLGDAISATGLMYSGYRNRSS